MSKNIRMKKVLSILLCLCIVLSYVPQTVFAEASDIFVNEGDTFIVEMDTAVNAVHLHGGTLIIEKDVTLTVTENFAYMDGHIENYGTIRVLGTGHCPSDKHVYNTPATGSSCDTMTCAICKRPGTHTMNSATGRCERCSEFVAEAKIGSIYYQKLQTAVENAQSGDTVILVQSVEGIVWVYIPSGIKITLDLNGFDWLNRVVNTSSVLTALGVEGELNLINSDTNKVSTVESVKYVADVDATGKLSVGANINFTAPDYEVGINSGIVDLSKADCENWKVKANGADLTVGENLLLPENRKLKQDGTVVETVSNGETARIEAFVQSYNLWIGGVEVTSNKTSGEGWSYDQTTNTLTLNGATITGGYDGGNPDHFAGIYATEALNIVLTGNNAISGSNCGIYASNALNISGGGSLTATGNYDGIKAAGDITISGGTVTANGTSSYGICAEGKAISITGGYVTANGGSSGSGIEASSIVLGIYSHVKVTHSSTAVAGTLSATGGLCRTSAIGTFTETIAASGAYFEYIGSNHVTYTKKDAQNHTVACTHGTSFDATHEYENGACVCTAEDPMYGCDFIVTGDTANYSWDKTNKVLTINGGNVTVSNKDKNTATSHRIYIQGIANVTLDGVNISSTTGAPIEIRDYSDTNVTLTLSGNNTLISQTDGKAALHKSRGQQATSADAATLTINGSGSLTAKGSSGAAGIGGGGQNGDTHNITINGGTIYATGGSDAAGIGSSRNGSTWNIVINGGNITATGSPGIGANVWVSGGVKDAAVTGGMVVANSYEGSTPTGGLVSTDGGKTFTVYSDYTLSQDLTIATDGKLTVAEGAELTVADGVTLTNEGVLVNNGTLSGSIANEGTIYNNGTLPANVGGNVYEQYVIVNNGSGIGIYTEGSTVTITADAPASGKVFTGWTIELGTVTLADSTKAETTFTMPEGCVIVKANYADIVATITDSNGNVKYYSDGFHAQEDWIRNGGTLTVYSDDFRLEHMDAPDGSVLDLNGHSVEPMMLHIRNSCTIQNGTILMWYRGTVEEDAVVTFKNVTITKDEYDSWEVEITNNGTIVDEGLTLNGVIISGGSVKTGLTEDRVTFTGIPTEGYVYDGTAHEPGVKCGETTLVAGTDYTVTFSNANGGDSTVNAGTITMTITGIGNYTGTVTKTYTIGKADPSIGAVTAGVVNDTLEISAIVLNRENTNVAGALTVDADQTIVLGQNQIKYTFVPVDTTNYKTVTGTVTVTVTDTVAPVIGGIENGKTYYTTQVVAVTDKNIDTITLNGKAVTSTITLEGNKEATYIIVATDKAGNTTTVTVKMAPIADVAESMEGKSESNVTSGDKASLQVIVDTITELLKDEELPAEEKEDLEKAKADAEALLKAIDDADKAADTENTDKVENVTADNVTPEDKSDLEKAMADLEKALKDNNGNYTAEEKKAIEGELKRIDDALKVIKNVEAVEDATSNLPATVVPDDEGNVAKIEAAKKAYDALSNYEKSLVSKQTKETLDKLTAAAVAYDIIKGDGIEWKEDSNETLSFTANGAVSRFLGIEINGKTVDPKYYVVKAGSTIVTLKQAYLDTLEAGKYTITFLYTNGETEGTFIVEAVEEETVPPTTEETKPGTVPETGDDANVMLWFSLMIVSCAAILVLLNYKRFFSYGGKYSK